ncbi:hypothetical protein [Micromonospora sp. HK10]|uniref:hypothetical protein n=1 Tax=Micromonospora sp. HK10 TaxID=1538294 RepID=UPI0006272225|nr:hypothetical protein [Micromonospora sp. HK10]KKK05160.1 hypothetical protein LQ51_15245 [Micromonospora sp. HK10]
MITFTLADWLLLLSLWLLAVQPAALPFSYAAVRRHRRLGGAHPILVAFGGWAVGSLLGAFTSAYLANLGIDSTLVLLLLSYPPVWLLAWLLARTATGAASTAARDNGPKSEDDH